MLKLKKTAAFAAIALLGGAVCTAADAPKAPIQTVPVEKVVEAYGSAEKKYIGRMAASAEVTMTTRISGTLEQTKFTEGTIVQQGQELYVIEDTTYRASKLAAEAKVAQIKAELEYAKSNYDRQIGLASKAAVAQSAKEEAIRLYELTKAKLLEAEAELLNANNQLSYTRISSPLTGRIGKSTYSNGNYITPSSGKLSEIEKIDPIRTKFSISERDFFDMFGNAATMRKEARVQIVLANDKLYPHDGKVFLVDNKVDPDTGTLMVWVEFPNKELTLYPGGLVTVYLSKPSADKFPAVKVSAVMLDHKGRFVYVVTPENVIARRDVATGSLNGNLQTILSGLKTGETVVVDGTNKVRPGMTVNPIAAEPAATETKDGAK